jgi:DNA-binding PadR family transcriptional regulator
MAKDNTTRYILLGLLSHEPMSGYDMKKRIDIMISKFWNVGYGQIYPTLNDLEKEGLIKKAMSETSKGPTRNVYAITSSGTEHLEKWLLLPEEREYTRYEILLKLFFGGKLDPAVSIQRIEAFRLQHEQDLKMLNLFEENLKQVMDKDPDHINYYMTVRFGQFVYKAYLDWAQETLHMLGDKQEKSEDESNEQNV